MLSKKWWICALTGSLLLLQGCQNTPQTERLSDSILNNVSLSKLIKNVPFYPQAKFFCGPTTLSEALNFYGHSTTPESIAPSLFIPGREGSLQLEMISAARTYGLLAYSTQSDFETLFALIDNDVPVIVFQNVATSWFPMWHYALVIGYDQTEQKIILHTGETKAHEMSYELFERVWQRGNYWMLALLKSEQTHKYLDPFIYTQAAHDMLKIGLNETALAHLITATEVWPKQWLSYFLLGNHFLNISDEAASWFSEGYKYASDIPEYLNNYGYALVQEGCISAAKELITSALKISPSDQNLLATKNEFDLIQIAHGAELQDNCASYAL